MKSLWHILLLQILQVPLIIAVFKTLENNQVAGVIAACIFATSSVYMAYRFFKAYAFRSPSLYIVLVNLCFLVLPMLYTRLSNWGTHFDQLVIMGVMGKEFHRFSENFYVVVFLVTLVEISLRSSKIRPKKA